MPQTQHPFRVSVHQSHTCTSLSFGVGLVQPETEEVISLSVAAVESAVHYDAWLDVS